MSRAAKRLAGGAPVWQNGKVMERLANLVVVT
jgi:hypothetical protein